ncbi:hypothetical protein CONPUDRAFT_84613 [Coniophora puteana RWD-64-598 SS2]|uniref:Uncharacterized protein n=1 Tax=Coniophora puteana (strain RWD-64-598) TaxID=741705 RepID=A0A5M3MBN3_CONPW|nr:uncharacterized protein CONPUDRAFT_84613 [Coniophora puteana RWD-64-598 SS2]EIW76649.1 hypothetical protein CONPUDRAFT_84613 [Coniophora puteana RWD-64-598 SS2]
MSFSSFYGAPRQGHLKSSFSKEHETELASFGACDVLVTGFTEKRFGDAWGDFKYIGRIRHSDGLIVLLRMRSDPSMGTMDRALFRGYIINSRNFVGRWRFVDGDQPAQWEAAFSLCKDTALS